MPGKTIKLSDGRIIPHIGLGTAIDIKNLPEIVYNSIKAGVRIIDTASRYYNEKEVGEGIKKALDEKIVKREDLFIITKVWVDQRGDPEKALKESLEKLGLDYVDLYLDHWPTLFNVVEQYKIYPIHQVWPKMEALVDAKLTKYIGVSNYNVQSLCNLLSFCRIKPEFNEIEFHPYLYQYELKEFCDKAKINILGFNPFCKGSYCNKEVMKELKINLFEEEIIKDLSKKYEKTAGQIILSWIISHGVIPIPATSNKDRMKENIVGQEFSLTAEEIQKIDKLNKNFHLCSKNHSPFLEIDPFA